MTNKEAAWHLGTYSTTMGSGQTTDEQHNEAKRIAIKVLDQEPCGDCIRKQDEIRKAYDRGIKNGLIKGDALSEIEKMPSVQPKTDIRDNQVKDELNLPKDELKTGWIPMTTRPMTEEEREHYREWSDVDGTMIFDCELPEDGQEVLVSYGGYVCVDTFCIDDGCYFEGVDIDEVDAWCPLPEPYKVEVVE